MFEVATGVCARPETANEPEVCVLKLVKFCIEFAGAVCFGGIPPARCDWLPPLAGEGGPKMILFWLVCSWCQVWGWIWVRPFWYLLICCKMLDWGLRGKLAD